MDEVVEDGWSSEGWMEYCRMDGVLQDGWSIAGWMEYCRMDGVVQDGVVGNECSSGG